MSDDKIARPAVWRDPQAAGSDNRGDFITEAEAESRVLILVEHQGNRARLAEALNNSYRIIKADNGSALPAEFDLAIVDGPGLRRWEQLLLDAKLYQQPVFLPVMFVLSRRDLRKSAGAHRDLIDEFIVAPVNRAEFFERAAMLLRTRVMAKQQRAELAYIVNHDAATGLPSQALFMDRIQTAVHNASILGQEVHVAVIHIELSRVMKSLGHHALERAAQICTTRLQHVINKECTLARLTTEDWGILPSSGTAVEEFTHMFKGLDQLEDEPIGIAGERLHLSARIGIGTYPADAINAAETLNVAYGALSRATGSGTAYFYSRDVQIQALRYLRTEARLHAALEQEQFELWFQPQFRLKDRAIIGAEALVRWRLSSGELVPPGDFISVAESSGLITRVDRWVLEAACHTLGRWREQGAIDFQIAVNITPSCIAEPDFVPWIKSQFDKHGVPPPWIKLELTETMLCDTNQAILDKLNELREYGVTVAIDDFGTGYSSLGYLHELPINVLKIDKSFTDRVPGDDTSEGITEAIIGLAQNFDLEIVAEGIETEEQLAYLNDLGVNSGQGFLIARPMPENEFLSFVADSLGYSGSD